MPAALAFLRPAFLAENPRLAAFALLATASSAFGQTFFLGLFGDRVRAAFELSHSHYGLIYAAATLASAALLLRYGALTDRWSLARQSVLAVSVLAVGCLLLAGAHHVTALWGGFLLVRFGGQAMLSHIGMTTAGRYFERNRGKVVAFAASGYPISEALAPPLAVALLLWAGWRGTWVAAALVLLVLILPAMLWLGRGAEHPQDHAARRPGGLRGLTRAQVLREPGFYRLLPAILAGPFIVTALLFHQSELALLKGWGGDALAVAFVAYGLGHLASLAFAGNLVDRIGAQRSLPFALAPMILGLACLASFVAAWVPWVFLGLLGFSQGAINTTLGAIWPERYGITHIGAIRSTAQTVMVVSTAASPVLLGLAFDAGVSAAAVAWAFVFATLAAGVLAARVPPDPQRR